MIRTHATRFMLTTLTTLIAGAWCAVADAQRVGMRTAMSSTTNHPGDVVRLDVICDCSASAGSAAVFDREVPLFRSSPGGAPAAGPGDHWHALIGIDLDIRPGTYPVTVTLHHSGETPTTATQNLVVVSKQFPTRRLTVEPAFVDPPPGELARIEKEAIDLQTLFADATRPRQWDGSFSAPVDTRPNSNFGARSVFNGQARNPHAGTDFAVGSGTPVASPAAGIVALAAPLYFTGNTVVIDHGLGLYSVLAHLSEFAVKQGDHVNGRQRVGLSGATGRVTAPHLHWSVRLNSARVDPLSLISATKLSPSSARPDTRTRK